MVLLFCRGHPKLRLNRSTIALASIVCLISSFLGTTFIYTRYYNTLDGVFAETTLQTDAKKRTQMDVKTSKKKSSVLVSCFLVLSTKMKISFKDLKKSCNRHCSKVVTCRLCRRRPQDSHQKRHS